MFCQSKRVLFYPKNDMIKTPYLDKREIQANTAGSRTVLLFLPGDSFCGKILLNSDLVKKTEFTNIIDKS